MNWNIFTFWSKSVVKNQMCCLFSLVSWSTGFGCSCLRYDRQTTPSAGIYARTGTDGNAREVFCEFRGRDDTQKVVVVVVVIFLYFVCEQRGGKPARKKDSDPHSLSGQVFLFLLYFINFFLILKRVLRVLSVWCQRLHRRKKLNGIVSSDGMAISCAQLRRRY